MKRRSLVCLLVSAVVAPAACGGSGGKLTELQRVKSGNVDIVLLSPRDAIKHGQDSFVIEFRSADGALVDVGDVKASATMPMPGAPMFGTLDVRKSAAAGRYDVDATFDMAGTWRTTIQWQGGPGGSGSATLSANVQ
jgi:YtkA-like